MELENAVATNHYTGPCDSVRGSALIHSLLAPGIDPKNKRQAHEVNKEQGYRTCQHDLSYAVTFLEQYLGIECRKTPIDCRDSELRAMLQVVSL